MIFFIFLPPKIKSAATEVTAPKKQTPVVAKLTQCEMDAFAYTNNDRTFIFYQIYLVYVCRNRRIIPKKKIRPFSH